MTSLMSVLKSWQITNAYLSAGDACVVIRRAAFQSAAGWVAGGSEEIVTMPLPVGAGNGLYYVIAINNADGTLSAAAGSEFAYSGADLTQVPALASGYTGLYYALTIYGMASYNYSYVTSAVIDAFGYGGTAGTPGGADTNVQYNDGGAFGGDGNLTWDKTGQVLTIGGAIRGTGDLLAYGAVGDVDDGYDAGVLGGNAKTGEGGVRAV